MHLDLAACRRGNSAIQLKSSAAQFESSTVQFGTSAVQFQRSAVQFESSALLELKGLAEDTFYAQMCCAPGRSLKGCKCFSHAGCLSSRSLRRICFMHKRMSRSLRMRVRDERKHTQERTAFNVHVINVRANTSFVYALKEILGNKRISKSCVLRLS